MAFNDRCMHHFLLPTIQVLNSNMHQKQLTKSSRGKCFVTYAPVQMYNNPEIDSIWSETWLEVLPLTDRPKSNLIDIEKSSTTDMGQKFSLGWINNKWTNNHDKKFNTAVNGFEFTIETMAASGYRHTSELKALEGYVESETTQTKENLCSHLYIIKYFRKSK